MDEIKLYLGDCLEIMKTIPDKSIDLVLTDLPDKIYGYTLCELKQIINYAKQNNFKPK